MSDTPPPPTDGPADSSPVPPSGSADNSTGLWQRYRAMPLWLQILIPVVIFAVVVGAVWALGNADSDSATSETTVAADDGLEAVLKGIIVVGGLTESDGTTTVPASAETPAATAPPTPASTESPASTAAAVATAAPTTAAPSTTAAPPTTEAPTSTDAPPSTEASATTASSTSGFPTTADFISNWNNATAGTNVPTITADQATELGGAYAGYYLVTLSPATASDLPPQVGLLGTLTSPGSGQLAELLLVWIPGEDDEGSSEFYWDCFGVLTGAVNPDTTAEETTELETSLGRGPEMPPFTTTANATGGGFDYALFSEPFEGSDGTIDISAISVN